MIRSTLASALATLLLAGAAQAETVAIVHAKAWTLTTDNPLENATIVITDGKIVSVAAGASAPAGARVIDAGNKPVTPGLMNAATRIGLLEVNAANETVDHTSKAPGLGAAFDVQYAINPSSLLIQQARADGLTRALTYPSATASPPFAGMGSLLRLAERRDVVERARAGVFVNISNRTAAATVGSRAAQWQILRTALDTAKTNLAAAASPTTRPPETLALEPVLGGTIPLAISTNRASDLRQAAKLVRDYNIRVVVIGGSDGWLVADELAAAKVAVIADPMGNLPGSFDELGSRLDVAALLHKAGVPVAMTLGNVQSYNAGAALRENAGLAVANGLPYVEGLRSIMSTPAQIWGVADRWGTLAAGKDGDLVIWDGDPLEPSTSPTAVLIAGKEVSLATHQTALRDRYLPAIKAGNRR